MSLLMKVLPYLGTSVKIKSKPWTDPQYYNSKEDGIPSCLPLFGIQIA